MTIKGKPRKAEELIEKGGHVQADLVKDEFSNTCLRINKKILKQIDNILEIDRPGLSRTAWIVEAIHEKIKRFHGEG